MQRFNLPLTLKGLRKRRVVERADSFYGRLSDLVRGEFNYGPYDVYTKEAWDRWNGLLANTHAYMDDQFERHAEVLKTFLED